MIKKIVLSIIVSIILAGCAVTDLIPKRKICDGEDKTLADLACKK